jgi:pSer/pThr/pTyr-binding forkhead associated (FHA) protein
MSGIRFPDEDDHGDSGIEVSATGGADIPDGGALLVVRRGPNAGSRFVLDEGVTTAGRSAEGTILLDDVTVSRRHAEFIRTGDRVVVRDVGSLNGTYVNRNRIDETELSSGDEVQIGRFRLLYLDRAGQHEGT